jgi:putative ubiquitin-RnfH superfamily antitoxin RatB of RatAB toxin-antitoxin module
MTRNFTVEVVYCLAEEQSCVVLQVAEGCSAGEAIDRSNLPDQFELQLEGEDPMHIGIFSNKCSLDTILKPGDRIEIYRPLILSPTEARRLRASALAEKLTS